MGNINPTGVNSRVDSIHRGGGVRYCSMNRSSAQMNINICIFTPVINPNPIPCLKSTGLPNYNVVKLSGWATINTALNSCCIVLRLMLQAYANKMYFYR